MSFMDVASSPLAPRHERNAAMDPSQAVTAGIFQMNTSVSTYKRLVNTLGTPKDTPELRVKLHKTREHITQLAKDVSAKLKVCSDNDHASTVPAEKRLSDAKLAKDLQAVMKEFQKAQKAAAEREAAYVPFIPPMLSRSSPDGESQEDQEKRALLSEQRKHEMIQMDNEVVFNEAVIEERDVGIREIQGQIQEVNEIFKDLAVLVHEQGHMIDDIDSNIESSHANVAQGNRQLIKSSKLQKSSNSTACCLMVFFALALIILILILTV
eukprot:TRINITY_DN636_c0_g1_i1.p1 TRINITY_DN636_c0_g1~~TRINITY_DN636_c0_g1_i1.p1  ORF type:complete len:267 (-),score=58.18 TRINITY_DN636_c0_g1_i1:249-1049(-)